MRVCVDIMEVQGQDVVLAANVHSIVVLIHTKDPVVSRVEQVGEVMSSASRSQFCMETQSPLMSAAKLNMHIFTHTTNTTVHG